MNSGPLKFELEGRSISFASLDDFAPLKPGVHVIGRHPGNDVVVGGWYRDGSRKHLTVDIGDGSKLGLTDLSTHGTFVPGSLLGGDGE